MKNWTIAVVVLVVSALVLTGCGGAATQAASAPPIPAGDAARGKTVFDGTCSACHGPDAKGISGLGKDLTTSEFAKGLSDAELVAFVKKGRPTGDSLNTTGVEMPAKGGNTALTDQDLADAVAYIRTLEK
jgi:disulfide bond formation protein DsbB